MLTQLRYAQSLLDKEQWDQAINLYKIVIADHEPHQSHPIRGLGCCFAESRQWQVKFEKEDLVKNKREDLGTAYDGLNLCFSALNRSAEALEYYR